MGISKLVRKHVGFHGQTAYAGAGVDTGLTQADTGLTLALLCLNSRGMKKGGWQVFGLDSHPCYWGSRWGYSWNTSYGPCFDVRTRIITGKPCMNPIAMFALGLLRVNLDLFGHIR